ncbi:MAG TPA: hypothetical protein VHP36_02370 [Chitinispirillaceae bacterium]|nr:hypothetical protein [Chitinispirillaceae bacterium]
MVKLNSSAIVWDMGQEQFKDQWLGVYRKTGSPFIEAIVISHRDLDHSGGMQFLDSTVEWSGIIVTSKYEDTSFIRALCKNWKQKIVIRVVCENDSLGYLPETLIRCIWPPSHFIDSIPVQNSSINKYSLVFTLSYMESSVIISSDIDSFAALSIAQNYKESLHSNILVVPHHGSAGSLNRIFLGYIKPETAIISCAKYNEYKHPSEMVVSCLRTIGANLRITYLDNSISFRSNGFYWVEN